MTESAFQSKIIRWLENKNMLCVKQNASGISRTGIPDLLVNADGTFLAIEVKKQRGITSELQKYYIKKINNQGGISIVLRPNDFETFKILMQMFILDNDYNRVATLKENLIDRIGTE